jgi:hypothetical protein
MTTDSVSATIFEAFLERWHRRVLVDRFPEEARVFLGSLGAGSRLALRLLTESRPAGWFGDSVELSTVAGEAAAEALADLDATTTVLTTGQSGLPGSPHYADMVDPWVRGAYLRLPHSPAAVEVAETGETRLEP